MSSVIVLTPNARRQTVKVTPNTTLLKVLEEACVKHGFKPEEYDIKHYSKIMDLMVPIRFSGLPNNALLEMVPVKKRRQEAHVTVALQLEENLQRITENFVPSDSLWAIIEKLCPEDVRNVPKVPVIVYMHREIVGIKYLSKTSLKDLGLTSGRAVLRLAFRDSEVVPELKVIGSGVYLHPQLPVTDTAPVQTGKEECQKHCEQQQVQENNKTVTTVPTDKTDEIAVNVENIATPHIVDTEQSTNDVLHSVQRSTGVSEQQLKPIVVNDKQVSHQNADDNISDDQMWQQSTVTVDSNQNVETVTHASSETESDRCSSERMDVENIEYVGERNALIFSPANEGPKMEVDLPDDFFNITVDDVRYLMRDLRQLREDMDNQPLTTSATKELNTSSKTLSLLHSYKHTVIRVQFPDRLVLQAIFSPLDTVETVMEFVGQFLEQPDLSFYLYSTPPKCILQREERLVEADCVPRALLYFGVSQSPAASNQQQQKYLKTSLLSSLTTQKQASAAALQVRRLDRNETRDKENNDTSCPTLNISNEIPIPTDRDRSQRKFYESQHSEPGTSGMQQNTTGPTVNKMPKWFKPL